MRSDARKRLDEKIASLPPQNSCGHFGRDFEGNCFACAQEVARREELAQAWDEGREVGWGEPTGYYRGGTPNPYRES